MDVHKIQWIGDSTPKDLKRYLTLSWPEVYGSRFVDFAKIWFCFRVMAGSP